MTRIQRDYYTKNDTLWLARDLLGKFLFCNTDTHGLCGGIITETEAYLGAEDKASHAWQNRRTNRTETMFSRGGVAYIYLCYGIHHLFNVVTGPEDLPHAVLIRGVLPVKGIENMEAGAKRKIPFLLDGPGKLTKAMGITTRLNGTPLEEKTIWIEDEAVQIPDHLIESSPRIGVDYAGDDAQLPYRFVLEDKQFLTRISKQYKNPG